jgi:transcriptional regulator with XRE-family HTH domain
MKRHALLDHLIENRWADGDRDLVELLDMSRSTISKIRCRNVPVNPTHILSIYDATNLSIDEIRGLIDKASKETNDEDE